MPQGKNRPPGSHAAGAGAYEQHAQTTTNDPRELEARVLIKAVRRLQELQTNWGNFKPEELEEALRYNRTIWMMFADTAIENKNGHELEVRNNIANLAAFVAKHSLQILAKPEKNKLDILIEINREIAAGLMSKPQQAQAPGTEPATAPDQKPGKGAKSV